MIRSRSTSLRRSFPFQPSHFRFQSPKRDDSSITDRLLMVSLLISRNRETNSKLSPQIATPKNQIKFCAQRLKANAGNWGFKLYRTTLCHDAQIGVEFVYDSVRLTNQFTRLRSSSLSPAFISLLKNFFRSPLDSYDINFHRRWVL